MRWTITETEAGRRLDVFLSECTQLTRSQAGHYIREGFALVDGAPARKAGFALRSGMELEFERPEPQPSSVQAQPIELAIVYQDQDLAVIFKPSGMVVHPAAGNREGTLVNALLYHLGDLSGIGGEIRPGIVHRIDKDTSGLLLVAKNDMSHVALSEQIAAHSLERAYQAILIGNPKQDSGSVEAPIGRHPRDRKKMGIVDGGRPARTDWRVLERLRGACLIEARLTTGRTHQIRVHMAGIGHPVLGDQVYGPKKSPYPVTGGQLLHAYKLGFIHPRTGEAMMFECEPEPRFMEWQKKLSM